MHALKYLGIKEHQVQLTLESFRKKLYVFVVYMDISICVPRERQKEKERSGEGR